MTYYLKESAAVAGFILLFTAVVAACVGFSG